MVGWKRRAWGALSIALGLAWAAGPAEACWSCTYPGCARALAGFSFCRTVVLFGQPTCIASGLCPGYPFGSGGPPDDFPKARRPVIVADPGATIDRGELTLFALTMPCARGCGVFEPGQTSRVVRRAASAGDAHAMLGGLMRSAGGPGGDLRVAMAEVAVGPGEYRGALAGRDQSGYAVRAERTIGGVSLSLCSIEAGLPGRPLAAETLGPEDLLLVRMWLEGEECVAAWSALAAGAANEPTPDRAAERRRAFVDDSRVLTLRARHPGFRLEALEPDAFDCP